MQAPAAPGQSDVLPLLRLAQESAGLVTFVWDIEPDRMHWVDSPAPILGAPGPDGRYPLFRDCVHPEDRPGWLRQRAEAASRDSVNRHEFRIVRTDGALRWLRATNRSIGSGTGRPRMLVVLQDITEQKAAERELHAMEERYRTLAGLSADWFWEQDEQFRFTWVSPSVKDFSGSSVRSHLGKTRWELPAIEVGAMQWAEHRAKLEAHEPFQNFEHQRQNEQGERIWMSVSGTPVWNEQGRFQGYRGITRNITKLKQAQEIATRAQLAAEETRRQLVDAIEALADGFVLYGPDDRLLICNRRYREIYRTSADLLVPGAKFEDIIRQGVRRGQYPEARNDPERWIAARMTAHLRGRSSIEQLTDDGRWLRIDERRTRDGGVVGFRVDITELKEATHRAEAASKAKSNFLAIMSHEMRTPLTVIVGFAEIALEGAGDAGLREDIGMILEGAQRLLDLVNGVLDFSKIEAGKLQLEISEFDLQGEMSRLMRSFEPQARAKGIALRHDLGPDVGEPVRGPRHALVQVVTNLVANAIKFSQEGEVSFRLALLRAGGAAAEIQAQVTDTGPGIAREQIERIFEPFVQIENMLTRPSGGTGLGLAITKRLVELMGGRMSVESAPGQGSTFSFTARIELTSREAAAALVDGDQRST